MTGYLRSILMIILLGSALCHCSAAQRKGHSSGIVGTAAISDLQGNACSSLDGGNYSISGTNVSVRLDVKHSWPDTGHECSIELGGSVLAEGDDHVRADPATLPNQRKIMTDANGNWSGRIYFDTTGLANSTSGDLRLSLLPTGHPAFKSNAIPNRRTYNKTYALYNHDMDPPQVVGGYTEALAARNASSAMNHSSTPPDIHTQHQKDTIIEFLPSYTMFFIYSHGAWRYTPPYENQTNFADCINDGMVEADRVASSLIPEKSAIQPYYNFVFISACESAGISAESHDDMAKAFGIIDVAGIKQYDRAYMGWKGFGYPEDCWWVDQFFQSLANGNTVEEAANDANQYGDDQIPRLERLGYYLILGDMNAILHKVYSGQIK